MHLKIKCERQRESASHPLPWIDQGSAASLSLHHCQLGFFAMPQSWILWWKWTDFFIRVFDQENNLLAALPWSIQGRGCEALSLFFHFKSMLQVLWVFSGRLLKKPPKSQHRQKQATVSPSGRPTDAREREEFIWKTSLFSQKTAIFDVKIDFGSISGKCKISCFSSKFLIFLVTHFLSGPILPVTHLSWY